MENKRNFASDNNASVHPEVMKALVEANVGHAKAYGDDEVTEAAVKKFKAVFGEDIEVRFVYNGTGANVLGLASVLSSYNSVICPVTAHINCDEGGAPEKFTSCKLVTVPSYEGKLHIEDVEKHLHAIGVEHHSQPKVISITQSTELGTIYKPEEIRVIADFAHKNGLYLHMDGARISNAAASLGLGLNEVSLAQGVDILSFGGTKNGLMYGEAVVFSDPETARNFKYIRKNGAQLASKMRYISAQFSALLTDDLWLRNAAHANRMTQLLYEKIRDIPGVKIVAKVEANAIFAQISPSAAQKLLEKYFFYVDDDNIARWMTAFDTTEQDVSDFAEAVKKAV